MLLHVLCQPTDASSPTTGAVAMTSENIDMTLGEWTITILNLFVNSLCKSHKKTTRKTWRAQEKPHKIHLLCNSSAGVRTHTYAPTLHIHAYALTHARVPALSLTCHINKNKKKVKMLIRSMNFTEILPTWNAASLSPSLPFKQNKTQRKNFKLKKKRFVAVISVLNRCRVYD